MFDSSNYESRRTYDNWRSYSSHPNPTKTLRNIPGRQRSESLKYYNPQVRNENLLLLANGTKPTSNTMHQCTASKVYRRKCRNIRKKQLCDR